MTAQELHSKLIELIQDQSDEESINDATTFESLGWDSMDGTELIMGLEDEVFTEESPFEDDQVQRLMAAKTVGEAFQLLLELAKDKIDQG